jgi:hypothetical protein
MVAELKKPANPSLTTKPPVTKKRTITPIENASVEKRSVKNKIIA